MLFNLVRVQTLQKDTLFSHNATKIKQAVTILNGDQHCEIGLICMTVYSVAQDLNN